MNSNQKETVNLSLVMGACGILLSGAAATATAQSTWNFFITDAGGGDSLVTWNVTGDLATPPGATWSGSGWPQAILVSAPGIYADSYAGDGTPQSLPTPDGSYLLNNSGDPFAITGYYTYHAPAGSDDGFGLVTSVGSGFSGPLFAPGQQQITYYSGTQSALIPVDYADFNPGFYQYVMDQFSPDLTVNLTVGAVPEPSTLALGMLGGLSGLMFFGRRR